MSHRRGREVEPLFDFDNMFLDDPDYKTSHRPAIENPENTQPETKKSKPEASPPRVTPRPQAGTQRRETSSSTISRPSIFSSPPRVTAQQQTSPQRIETSSSTTSPPPIFSPQEPATAVAMSSPKSEEPKEEVQGNEEVQDNIDLLFDYDLHFSLAQKKLVDALFDAAKKGDIGAVQGLVKQGIPLNVADNMGQTPLLMATKHSQLQMVEFLVGTCQGLATVGAKCWVGEVPLLVAVEKGDFEVVVAFLKTKEGRATIGYVNSWGRTPLLIATKARDFRMVAVLLEIPEGRALVTTADKRGETPLSLAEKNKDAAITAALLAARQDIAPSQMLLKAEAKDQNDTGWIWQHNLTPAQRVVSETLFAAAAKGDLKTVQNLIKGRTLLKIKNSEGRTAFHEAVRCCQVSIVETLLNTDIGNELSIERDLFDNTPLFIAISDARFHDGGERLPKILSLLLRNPADHAMLNPPTDTDRETLLHLAVYEGHIEAVKFLLKIPEGLATINHAYRENGETPLAAAAIREHWDIGVLLLTHKADLQAAQRYLTVKSLFNEGTYPKALKNLKRIHERYKSEFKQVNNAVSPSTIQLNKLRTEPKQMPAGLLKESKHTSMPIVPQTQRNKPTDSSVEAFENFKALLNHIHQLATGQTVQTHPPQATSTSTSYPQIESKTESKDAEYTKIAVVGGVRPVELIARTPFPIILIRATKLLVGFHYHPDIIPIICKIIFLKGTVDKVSALEPIRKKLRAIMLYQKNELVQSGAMTLCDAAHQALLALAQYLPLNEDDDMGKPIRPGFHIFVSTGHQFDVFDLARWHRKRKYQCQKGADGRPIVGADGEPIGEKQSGKLLLNYYVGSPGTPFDDRDWHHIVRSAVMRGISIEDLQYRPEPPAVPLSPEESVRTEELVHALIGMRLMEKLTEASATELLSAKNSQERCQLIVALHKVQELTPEKLTALIENPLYMRGLSWGLTTLRDTSLFTPSNQKRFLQQDSKDIFLLAHALHTLREEGERIQQALQEEDELPQESLLAEYGLTQASFERLFTYAKGLVRALAQLQLANKIQAENFLVLFKHAECADDFAQCLETVAKIKPITQNNVDDLLRLGPSTKGLALCLRIFQELGILTSLTFNLLLEKAQHIDDLAQCLQILLTIKGFSPASFIDLLKQAQHAKSVMSCLKIFQEMGISDPQIFSRVVENAPFSAGLMQGLSVLRKAENLNPKTVGVLLQHIQFSESLGQILESLQAGNLLDKDNKNFYAALARLEQIEDLGNVLFFLQEAGMVLTQRRFNILLGNAEKCVYVSHALLSLLNANLLNADSFDALLAQIIYIVDLSKALESLYQAQSLNQKNFGTLLKNSYHLEEFNEELAFLQATGIVLTSHMCTGLLRQFQHWEAWRGVSHCLREAGLLTQKRVISLFEHDRDIAELHEAFACLESFEKLMPANIVVLLQHSQHAGNLAKALRILYDAKLLPAIPETREALAAQAQYIDDLLPLLNYLQENTALDQTNLYALLAQAQHAGALVKVLHCLQKRGPLNPQVFMAVFVAQASDAERFITGIQDLQAAGIDNEQNQAALTQHIAQADDLAQALVSLHKAGIPDSESRPELLKRIQYIAGLNQGCISLQLAGVLDRRSFLILLDHPQHAASLGQALACLHRAGMLEPPNRDALLANIQHIDSLSRGMTDLQRRGKLTPRTFAALLEQPQRAVSLGRELADIKESRSPAPVSLELCFWQCVQRRSSDKGLLEKTVKMFWPHLTVDQLLTVRAFATTAASAAKGDLLRPHDFTSVAPWLTKVSPPQGPTLTLGAQLLLYCLFKTGLSMAAIESGYVENEGELVSHIKWSHQLLPLMGDAVVKGRDQDPLQALTSFAARRVKELAAVTTASTSAVVERETKEYMPAFTSQSLNSAYHQSTTPLAFFGNSPSPVFKPGEEKPKPRSAAQRIKEFKAAPLKRQRQVEDHSPPPAKQLPSPEAGISSSPVRRGS